jgi:Flp pilus assembly protein TadD
LALVCLIKGKTIEADQSIRQSLQLGIKDAQIMKKIGKAFLKRNNKTAAEALLMSLEMEPEDDAAKQLFEVAIST